MRRWLAAGLLPLFAVMTWQLNLRHHERLAQNERQLLDIEKTEQAGARYFGLYYGPDQIPIGYSLRQTLPEQDGGSRLDTMMFVKLKVLDRPQDVQTVGSVYHDPQGRLVKFDFRLQSPAGSFFAEGKVKNPAAARRTLDLKVTGSQGLNRRLSVALPKNLVFYDEIPPRLVSAARQGSSLPGPPSPRQFTFTVLDPANLSLAPLTATVLGWRRSTGGQRVLRAGYDYKGTRLDMVIDQHGEVLSEQSPLGFSSKRITYGHARQLAREQREMPDIARLTAVTPTGKAITDPSRVVTARYRLTGVSFNKFNAFTQRGQTLIKGELRVHPAIPRSGQGLSAAQKNYWLAPTLLTQSDDPALRGLARRLSRGTTSASAARRIQSYVYESLEKMPVVSLPSAVDILRDKKGDCNEHATLYAALARAAGIPTRVVGGVVMLRGVFLYHAWNEVFVDGQWQSVDATLDQMPVDATHLRFVQGRDARALSPLMSLMGQLKIEVLKIEVAQDQP